MGISIPTALWSAALPLLCLASVRAARAGPHDERSSWPAFLAFGIALGLRLAVDSMPSDLRPDVALDGLYVMEHRVSAINSILWRVVAACSRLGAFSLWNGIVMTRVLAFSLAVLAVHRFALRDHGDRPAAFAAALILACSPPAVRFSATESPCVLAALFLALALDLLSLAANNGDGVSFLAGVGWLAALVEVRPEGAGFALGALLFLSRGWRAFRRVHPAVLTAAGLGFAALTASRAAIDVGTMLHGDLAPSWDPARALRGFLALPFNDFAGPLWGALCAAGLALHAVREPRAAAWRLLGLLAGTYALVVGYGMSLDRATNIRHYLPALVLVCVPMAHGLSIMTAKTTKLPAAWRPAALAVLVAAAPLGAWRLLSARWATQEEFHFALKSLAGIEDGCVIMSRPPLPGLPGALEVGPVLSVLAGRRHDWRFLEPADAADEPAPGGARCVLYYRGGRCELLRLAVGGPHGLRIPDDCGELERRWRLDPVMEGRVGGWPLFSETYRRNPYPARFSRVSAVR